MIPKGLSHYQSLQKNVFAGDNHHLVETIMEKAAVYNMPFLQNRALMEAIVAFPDQRIAMKQTVDVEKLLLWLYQTQEEAKLS